MSPFDDFRAFLADLPGPDEGARTRMGERTPRPDAPDAALGRLAEVAVWLAGWSGRTPPQVTRPVLALYAGGHAAEEEGAGRARRRLEVLAAGGSPVNAMAQRLGAGLDAFDLAVDRPVRDMAVEAAMSVRECAATLAFGMEALAKSPDLLLVGEAGGGGDASAQALAAAFFGGEPGGPAGDAVARVREEGVTDPFELLRQLGGRETAAMTGAILAARVQRTPVILDGPEAAAAAAVLHVARPGALDHCLAAHAATPAHAALLAELGLVPLLTLDIRLGEGVGAVSALSLVQLACAAVA
jgi:nicotinate-nucleotide--dimethylbenzimidazole phosphoribosyltransferase